MRLSGLPAKVARRLVAVAEAWESGPGGRLRRKYPDCYATVRAFHRLHPGSPGTLFDVGASRGHWTTTFKTFFPGLRKAVLFEPLPDCVRQLETLRWTDTEIEVVATALGREEGSAVLAGSGPSASIQAATDLQHRHFPGSIDDATRPVSVRSLDGWLKARGAAGPDVLKIDVQGFELEVLCGAETCLADCRWLIVELSMVELYAGQPLAGQVLAWLEARGWHLAEIGYQWRSREGTLLQFDAILQRGGAR